MKRSRLKRKRSSATVVPLAHGSSPFSALSTSASGVDPRRPLSFTGDESAGERFLSTFTEEGREQLARVLRRAKR